MTDAEDDANWLLDTLGDLLDEAKDIVTEHLARLRK